MNLGDFTPHLLLTLVKRMCVCSGHDRSRGRGSCKGLVKYEQIFHFFLTQFSPSHSLAILLHNDTILWQCGSKSARSFEYLLPMTPMCLQRSFNRLRCHSSTLTLNEVRNLERHFLAWLRRGSVSTHSLESLHFDHNALPRRSPKQPSMPYTAIPGNRWKPSRTSYGCKHRLW